MISWGNGWLPQFLWSGEISLDEVYEEIFRKASLCRAFEREVFRRVQAKELKIPVYLSAGQEYSPAVLSTFYRSLTASCRQVFIQHRGHSTYICFGGDIDELILELLGDEGGCAGGMGGSASIHSVKANIYGHDGLMGSHGPIAVGMCFANRIPTFCFIGDAAAEEDYFLGALGWAATKSLPIVFIVEDNNLSILTEKSVRRSWGLSEVAGAFGIESYDVDDDPDAILEILPRSIEKPLLLNVNTTRLFWHSGAGVDSDDYFDRHDVFSKRFGPKWVEAVNEQSTIQVRESWQRCLNRLGK